MIPSPAMTSIGLIDGMKAADLAVREAFEAVVTPVAANSGDRSTIIATMATATIVAQIGSALFIASKAVSLQSTPLLNAGQYITNGDSICRSIT
jgi:hypothetical protein